MTAFLCGAIRLYQVLLSPLIPPHCRFQPTCSEYALLSIRRHGAWTGSWKALGRLSGCHPLGRCGYDPVD